jgi:hypothetical protein
MKRMHRKIHRRIRRAFKKQLTFLDAIRLYAGEPVGA